LYSVDLGRSPSCLGPLASVIKLSMLFRTHDECGGLQSDAVLTPSGKLGGKPVWVMGYETAIAGTPGAWNTVLHNGFDMI